MSGIERYDLLEHGPEKSYSGHFVKFSDHQRLIADKDVMIDSLTKQIKAARNAIIDMDESFFVNQWSVCDSTMEQIFVAKKELEKKANNSL